MPWASYRSSYIYFKLLDRNIKILFKFLFFLRKSCQFLLQLMSGKMFLIEFNICLFRRNDLFPHQIKFSDDGGSSNWHLVPGSKNCCSFGLTRKIARTSHWKKSLFSSLFHRFLCAIFNGVSVFLQHAQTSPILGVQSPQFNFTDVLVYMWKETTNGMELS